MYYLVKGQSIISMCINKGPLEKLCVDVGMEVIEDERFLDGSIYEVINGQIVQKNMQFAEAQESHEPPIDEKALLKSMLDLTDVVIEMQGQIDELGEKDDGKEIE